MSVSYRVRVAGSTAVLSLALALAMTGTALAAAPTALPVAQPGVSGFSVGVNPGPVPTTPAVPVIAASTP